MITIGGVPDFATEDSEHNNKKVVLRYDLEEPARKVAQEKGNLLRKENKLNNHTAFRRRTKKTTKMALRRQVEKPNISSDRQVERSDTSSDDGIVVVQNAHRRASLERKLEEKVSSQTSGETNVMSPLTNELMSDFESPLSSINSSDVTLISALWK